VCAKGVYGQPPRRWRGTKLCWASARRMACELSSVELPEGVALDSRFSAVALSMFFFVRGLVPLC